MPHQYVTPSFAPNQVIMHSKCPLDKEFLAHISNQSIFFKTSQRNFQYVLGSFLFPFQNQKSEPKPQQPNVHLLGRRQFQLMGARFLTSQMGFQFMGANYLLSPMINGNRWVQFDLSIN